jgi:ArsR family transcriptional regulator
MGLTKTEAFPITLQRLAQLADAIAHPARLQILQTLAARGTCICGEIVELLPLSQATVSQHLKALKNAGLVQGEVEGPRTCYCLNPEGIAELERTLAAFTTTLQLGQLKSCC